MTIASLAYWLPRYTLSITSFKQAKVGPHLTFSPFLVYDGFLIEGGTSRHLGRVGGMVNRVSRVSAGMDGLESLAPESVRTNSPSSTLIIAVSKYTQYHIYTLTYLNIIKQYQIAATQSSLWSLP